LERIAAVESPFDFVASYWTIAGDARLRLRGGTDYSSLDLRERIETASASGYRGIGFHSRDLQHWSDRYAAADVRRLLDDNGIGYVELEILREWFVTGPAREESDRTRRELLAIASELPIDHIKVGSSFGPHRWPTEHIAEEFATLCAEFAQLGTRVGLEPVAVASIRTPAEALEVIDRAGAANGGLILDTPGMRELALWDADAGLEQSFADLEALASTCRFSDCRHEGEPGCAVLAAVAGGALAADRLEAWQKLEREARHLERRVDALARAEERRRWKVIGKSVGRHMEAKYGRGGS